MAVLQSGPALSLSKRTHAVLGLAPSAVCACMCVRLCVGFVARWVYAMCVLGWVWARECYDDDIKRESCYHVIKTGACYSMTGLTCVCVVSGVCASVSHACLTRVLLNP